MHHISLSNDYFVINRCNGKRRVFFYDCKHLCYDVNFRSITNSCKHSILSVPSERTLGFGRIVCLFKPVMLYQKMSIGWPYVDSTALQGVPLNKQLQYSG